MSVVEAHLVASTAKENSMKNAVMMITLILFVYSAGAATAASPDLKLPYQKKLAAAATTSATATPVSFRFSLHDAEVDGTKYWEETKTISITSTTRLISTILGDGTPLNAGDFSNHLWVQVESNGIPEEMPRELGEADKEDIRG
jgi:hypothetical protein